MKNAFLAVAVFLLLLCGGYIYLYKKTPKIAYVDSARLYSEYSAMKDAREEYEAETQEWQSNLKTLQKEIDQEIFDYQKRKDKLPVLEKEKTETRIRDKQKQYLSYNEAIKEKAATKENELGQKLLTKINSFINDYGKDHGYDLILGTGDVGTVIYADGYLDITKEVVDALNQQYISKKKVQH